MAYARNSKILQVLSGQAPKDVGDRIVAERAVILPEGKIAEPPLDVYAPALGSLSIFGPPKRSVRARHGERKFKHA
jgi:hypothetical protein